MAAPSLSTEQIRKIERLIDIWNGKLTWALLILHISDHLDIKTTRQTLDKYPSIKSAYDRAKARARGRGNMDLTQEFVRFTESDVKQFERLKRLEAENESLKRIVDEQCNFFEALIKASETDRVLKNSLDKFKRSQEKKRKKKSG